MNREWSELNKTMQMQIKKEATFQEGIVTLLTLRQKLTDEIFLLRRELDTDDFSARPFASADGYHSKTIAYSIWHVFRIEDIVAHTLIKGDEQIFFLGNYQKRIGSPIITTGNELVKEQISDFSKQLNLDALYQYMAAVNDSTNGILKNISFTDLKRKIKKEEKEYLRSLAVVSDDENAHWLIDYWCGKDFRGLIQMPFSRHWIMHIEACLRIKKKLL
ncbi:Uncharacterised protein [uncultured Eubacterium sp.]|nr:Uncharacterised protein [uncultured Eubacterium sp.]